MRIAVDARELSGRATGVGRYLAHLLREWARDPGARSHHFTLYTHTDVAAPPDLPGDVRVLRGGGGTRWEQMTLCAAVNADRPDVLFAPGYSAPLLARAPIALTIHDVSFVAHPEWFPFREGLRRRLLTAASSRRAAVVLTDSAFSKREILAHLGIPANRIHVVPLGIDPAAPAREQTREPIVLFVGSIFARRHVPDLIAAFGRVAARRPDVRLQIVGDDRSHPPEPLREAIASTGAGDRIALRAWIAEDELRSLYARARVFAFLSEYEGFGLTPLEALAAGVPAVVLDTPIAREVYGAAALYVSRGDLDATAAAIETLLDDTAQRRRLLAEAPGLLARYDWSHTARMTLALIETLGVGSGAAPFRQ